MEEMDVGGLLLNQQSELCDLLQDESLYISEAFRYAFHYKDDDKNILFYWIPTAEDKNCFGNRPMGNGFCFSDFLGVPVEQNTKQVCFYYHSGFHIPIYLGYIHYLLTVVEWIFELHHLEAITPYSSKQNGNVASYSIISQRDHLTKQTLNVAWLG